MICGILACLLHGNKFKRGDKEDVPTARSGQGLRQNSFAKKRILVCAQSNSAIDELLGAVLLLCCVNLHDTVSDAAHVRSLPYSRSNFQWLEACIGVSCTHHSHSGVLVQGGWTEQESQNLTTLLELCLCSGMLCRP